MLRFKYTGIFLVFFILFNFSSGQEKSKLTNPIEESAKQVEEQLKNISQEQTPKLSKDEIKALWEEGIRQYNNFSYYTAIDIFSKILKHKDSEYYPHALFMMAKIYYQIGKRTGFKKYLWYAIYYINTYIADTTKDDWETLYLKGLVYEALGFYERALALYKLAQAESVTLEEETKTLIGMLRSVVGMGKMDMFTKYLILINLDVLKEAQRKELNFIKGMVDFANGDYKEALNKFIKTYKNYESYLIENPSYYYMVGETAYRLDRYTFAKQVFRRLISVVKDPVIIRRSILRIGDIDNNLGDTKSAVNFYYLLVSKYPDSREATVARLKLMYLMEHNEIIKYRLMKTGLEEFKDPIKYVVITLVSNRTNYIGRFALGNFGDMVMELNSDKLFKRLQWEISLIDPPRLDYEQIEYIQKLWKPDILKIESNRICELYDSNPKFFKKVFDRETLIHISNALMSCDEKKERIDLLKFVLKKWNTDENKYLLAKALFEIDDYKNSIKVLRTIKRRKCKDYVLMADDYIMLNKKINKLSRLVAKFCPNKKLKALIVINYNRMNRGILQKPYKFVMRNREKIYELYPKDKVVNKFIKRLTYKLLAFNKYEQVKNLMFDLATNDNLPEEEKCYTRSITLISLVRTNKIERSKPFYEKIKECKTEWSQIARKIFESSILFQEVKR